MKVYIRSMLCRIIGLSISQTLWGKATTQLKYIDAFDKIYIYLRTIHVYLIDTLSCHMIHDLASIHNLPSMYVHMIHQKWSHGVMMNTCKVAVMNTYKVTVMNIYKVAEAKRKLAEVEAKRKQGRKIIISCSFLIFIVLILSFSVYCHRMLII